MDFSPKAEVFPLNQPLTGHATPGSLRQIRNVPWLFDFSARGLNYFWYLQGGRLFKTGRMIGTGYLFLFWETAERESKLLFSFDWGSKQTCRLSLPDRLVILAKFWDRIFRLKEQCASGGRAVDRLRRRLFSYREAFSEQLKKDGPRLISMFMCSNSAITKTE